ncbi:hypothetical protein ACJMK2_013682 [Sinanodonta woodiana]|uniref:ITPR-interacting domain-containing protein n=1 Tax=Sinanodonta woodiana TaxID=1069815 RepID=A0ABD3UYW9_SINWO
MTKVASSDNAVSNKIMKPDTGGSDGPNKESGADQRRDQNRSDVKDTSEKNEDPFEESPNPKAPESIDSQMSMDDEENSQIEAEAIDAELPVGVDAVSLGQSSVRFRDQTPDDKRDGQLPIYEQNGVQIGPMNKRVKWIQSMEKSKGSSSNSSGSVEMILQDREMDPEDVLKSLGFCGKEDETDVSFARVPDRFFLTSSAATGIDQVRIVWDHPEIHHLIPLMQRKENQQHLTEVNGTKTEEVKGARGAWGRAKAKSFSSVLQGMKFLSMFQSPYQHPQVVNPAYRPVQHIPPEEGMEDVPTILELPNFQFLAKQGFYRQVPNTKPMDFKSNENVRPNMSEKPKTLSAAQKRKQFSRSCRSKWSLTSPDEEDELEKNAEKEVTFDDSTESKEKNASVPQAKNVLDLRSFSIGFSEDSIDSNESLSLTTPSTPSPQITTSAKESKIKRQSSIQEIRKNLQESRKTIADSSDGNRSSVVETSVISNQGISDLRKDQVEKLMTSEIDDGDYKVDDVRSRTCAASPDLIKESTVNNKDGSHTSGNMAVSTEKINIKNRMMFRERDQLDSGLLSVEKAHLIVCRSESSHTLVPTDFSMDEEIDELQNQSQSRENDDSFSPNNSNIYGESEVKETAKGAQLRRGSLKQLDVNLKLHPQESYELEEMLEPLTDEQQGLLDKFPHGIRGALEKTASMQSDSSGFADADLNDNKNGNRETSPESNTTVDYIVPQTNNNNDIVQTYNHQTCVCKTQGTYTCEKHRTITTDQSSRSRDQCHIHGTKDCQEHNKKEYSGQCPSLHSITYDRSHPATPVAPGKSAKKPGALLYTINLPITYTKADETSMDIKGEISSKDSKTLENIVPEISVTPPSYCSQIHIEIDKDSRPIKTQDNCLNIVKSASSVPEGTQHQKSISSQTGPSCTKFGNLGFSTSHNSQYPVNTKTQNYSQKQTVLDDIMTSEKSLYSQVTPSKGRQPLSVSTPMLNNCGQNTFEDPTISNMTDDWLPREHIDSHMYNLNIMSAGTVSSYSLTSLEYPPQQRNVSAFDKGPVLGDTSLDYLKLTKLVNQPPTTNLIITLGGKIPTLKYHHRHYHKKLHLTEKRKLLEEESLLVQHALQKYNVELTFMETAFFHTYQTAYEELSEEERAEVEDLQRLWCELKKEILEMEQLISSRLSGICAGNENFQPLDALKVVNQMINLLREQLFQQQIMICHDSCLDNDEEYETISNRSSVSMASVSSAGQIWPDLSQQISEMKEQLTKSRSSLCQEMEGTLSEKYTESLS